MSALATPEERNAILHQLTETLKAEPALLGLVLVGSGAHGFHDTFSDIDLVAIVREDAPFPMIYDAVKARIGQVVQIAYAFERHTPPDAVSYSAMLNNFLQVDLDVAKPRGLNIRDKTWKILHDPQERVNDIISQSFSETLMVAPRRLYMQAVERIWQPVLACVAAINRDQTWRALHMLEQIRNQAIQLAGINHRLDTERFSQVDELPEMLLVNLRHTIPTSTSKVAIRRALRATLTLFFEEARTLETVLRLDFAHKMQEKLMPYIEAYS
jgi:hypothetical protein